MSHRIRCRRFRVGRYTFRAYRIPRGLSCWSSEAMGGQWGVIYPDGSVRHGFASGREAKRCARADVRVDAVHPMPRGVFGVGFCWDLDELRRAIAGARRRVA